MLRQELTLLLDNLLNQRNAFLHRQTATQAFIMNTTHGRGIDILVAGGLT